MRAEWEQAWFEWWESETFPDATSRAFRAGARWMLNQACNHLGYEVEQHRDDDSQYELLAHVHTDVTAAMLHDVGDWGNQEC